MKHQTYVLNSLRSALPLGIAKNFMITLLQTVVVSSTFKDTGATGVVVGTDDVQLRTIEGCRDATQIEQQMGQGVDHQRTVFRRLYGQPAVGMALAV
jgi:hypothetical protein